MAVDPHTHELRMRLELLEADGRRWRRGAARWRALAVGLLVSGPALVLMGQDGAGVGKTIQAEKFQVVDRAGKVRAELALEGGEVPYLRLADAKQKQRVLLGLNQAGVGTLSFIDAEDRPRINLALTDAGEMGLTMHATDGSVRLALSTGPDVASLQLNYGQGKLRSLSFAKADGSAFQAFFGEDGKLTHRLPE